MNWLQVRNHSASKPRRKSLDPQDLLTSSPPWSAIGSPALNGREEDRESSSGDWVDKVMVNKHDILSRDDNMIGQCEVENRLLSEKFYQSYPRDPTKIYPEQQMNRLTVNRKENQDYHVQRNRGEVASTDDSDHDEAAASDCSEPDMSWQCNIPKISNIPSGLGSKPKKTQPKTATKIPETR